MLNFLCKYSCFDIGLSKVFKINFLYVYYFLIKLGFNRKCNFKVVWNIIYVLWCIFYKNEYNLIIVFFLFLFFK